MSTLHPPPSSTHNSSHILSKEGRLAFIKSLEESSLPLTDSALVEYERARQHQREEAQAERQRLLDRAKQRARKRQASVHAVSFQDDDLLRGYATNAKSLEPNIALYQYLAPTQEKLNQTIQLAKEDGIAHAHAHPGTEHRLKSKYLLSRLRLNIPDTIINTATGTLVLHTDAEGYVCQTARFTTKQVLGRLTYDAPIVPPSVEVDGVPLPPTQEQLEAEAFISAVVKTPGATKGCNEIGLLTPKDIKSLVESKLDEGASSSSVGSTGSEWAIQKFIRPTGQHACLYRTVWQPSNEKVLGKGVTYVITNQLRMDDPEIKNTALKLLVSPSNHLQTKFLNIVKQQGKACEEMLYLTGTIALHLSRTLSCGFSEIVCDFTKDSFGRIIFLQVKSFRLYNGGVTPAVRPHTKSTNLARRPASAGLGEPTQRTSRCALCKRFLPVTKLKFQMTSGMMKEFKRHLETHGRSSEATFLLRMMTRGHKFGGGDLSGNHSTADSRLDSIEDPGPFGVCETCQEVFQAIQGLKVVSRQFAGLVGIPKGRIGDSTTAAGSGGGQGSDLEAEDGYRLRSILDTGLTSLGGDDPSASSTDSAHSRARTATSILTHSSLIPSTRSTLISNGMDKEHQLQDVLLPASSIPHGDFSSSGGGVSTLSTVPGRVNVKIEHVSLAPETMVPLSLHVARMFVYLDFLGNVPEYLPAASSGYDTFTPNGGAEEVIGGVLEFSLFDRETRVEFTTHATHAGSGGHSHGRVQVKDLLPAESNSTDSISTGTNTGTLQNVIFLNRLALFYFFCSSKESFSKVLERPLVVRMKLKCKNVEGFREAGEVELNLRQFSNPLVYSYSYLSLFRGNPLGNLSSLKITLGSVLDSPIDTSLVNLRPFLPGVFIADNERFYTCDPLPKEWLQALPDVAERDRRLQAKNPVRKEYDWNDPFADLLAPPPPLPTFDDEAVQSSPLTSSIMQPRPPSVLRAPSTSFMPIPPAKLPKPKLNNQSKNSLTVQVHAIYCCRAKYALVIEFQLFGQTHVIQQKQQFRLNANATGNGGAPPNAQATKVVIFDSNEVVPIPKDFEDQLPTFIVLNVKEQQLNKNRTDLLVRRRTFRSSLNKDGTSDGQQTSAANQVTRGSWSVTVNISEIKQQQQSVMNTSESDGLSVPDSGAGGGSVEGTFDLIPTIKLEEDRYSETPYMSLAIRYQ